MSFFIPGVRSCWHCCMSFICMLIPLHERLLSKMLRCTPICGKCLSHETNHYSFSIRNPEWLHSHKCNSRFSGWMIIAFHNVLYWNATIFTYSGDVIFKVRSSFCAKLFCNLCIFSLRIIKNVHLLSYPAVAVDSWRGKWLFTLLLFFGCFFFSIRIKQSDWLIKSIFYSRTDRKPPHRMPFAPRMRSGQGESYYFLWMRWNVSSGKGCRKLKGLGSLAHAF